MFAFQSSKEPHFQLLLQAMGDVSEDSRSEYAVDGGVQFTTLPRGAVEVLADGWYKWRGFKKQAWDFEEGWQLLNEAWQEQQQMHAAVSRRARGRKE